MNGLRVQVPPVAKQIAGFGLVLVLAYGLGSVVAEDNTLLISLIVAGLLVFVAVWQQRLLLHIFVIAYVCFYEYFSYTQKPLLNVGANIYLGDIFIFLFLSSTIVIALSKGQHRGLQSPLGVAIALYLAWAIICIIRGIPVWGHSAVGESRFIMWASLYFPVVHAIRDMKQFRRFLMFFLLVVLGYLVYLQAWRYFVEFQGDLGLMIRSRLMGADLGLIVVSIFVYSLALLLTGGVSKNKPWLFLLTAATGTLVPFAARTAWVALSISTGFVILIFLRGGALKRYVPLLALALILGGTFINLGLFGAGGVLDPQVEKGLGFTTQMGQLEGTTYWRLFGWQQLISEALQSDPVFGQGFGGYYDIFEVELRGVPPHNDWLVIFSKMGVVGLILFLAVVIQFYSVGFKFIRQSTDPLEWAYMRGLLPVFLVGLVGGAFFGFFPFMWIAAGLQTALVKICNPRVSDH